MTRMLFLLLISVTTLAADFEVRVKESLLNDFSEAMGTKSFSGSVNVGFASQNYTVTAQDIEVEARSSGLTYEAQLKVQFMGLTQYIDVEGDVEASIQSNKLTLELESLNLPVRVSVPNVGEVTLFTIQTGLSHKLNWRFHPKVNLAVAGTLLQGKLEDLEIDTAYQELVLSGDISF